MRILVIEDEFITAQNIRAILASDDATLDTVETGEEGLRHSAHQLYQLIILDLSLPDMHGLSVLKALRSTNCVTPIMVLSGDARSEMRSTCLERGADDYLTKPFHSRELVARVHAIGRRVGGYTQLMIETGAAVAQLTLLTRRERDVLNEIAGGRSNKVAAQQLGISPRTVEVHRAKIMKKLQAASFADVVRIQSAASRATGVALSA